VRVHEDITPSDVPIDPLTIMQSQMTRARIRQLNLEMSSLISDIFIVLRIDGYLMMLSYLGTLERVMKYMERVVDEDIPTIHASSSINHPLSNIKDTNQGPLTRSHAKKLQEQVNSFLTDYNFNTSKNVILPKCSILMSVQLPMQNHTILQCFMMHAAHG